MVWKRVFFLRLENLRLVINQSTGDYLILKGMLT